MLMLENKLSAVVSTLLGLIVLAGQVCLTSAPSPPRYLVKMGVGSSSCIKCMAGLLTVKQDQLGALRGRVVVEVYAASSQVKRQLDMVVVDSSIISVKLNSGDRRKLDTAAVFIVGSNNPLTVLKMPDGATEILGIVDSLDAQQSVVMVDTLDWLHSWPLKTHIKLDERVRVHVHDDGKTASVALIDRALVTTFDTAYVLPQYNRGLPDSIKQQLVLPQETIVFNANRVRYRITTAGNAIDTVINGEEARLYRSYRYWLSDVNRTDAYVNKQIIEIPLSEQTFGTWANTDSTYVSIP